MDYFHTDIVTHAVALYVTKHIGQNWGQSCDCRQIGMAARESKEPSFKLIPYPPVIDFKKAQC